MNEYIQIIVTAMCTGMGTGIGVGVGTYLANKGLIRNMEKLVLAIKPNGEKEHANKTQKQQEKA